MQRGLSQTAVLPRLTESSWIVKNDTRQVAVMMRPAAQHGAEAQARRQNGGEDDPRASGADTSLCSLKSEVRFHQGI